MLNIIYKYIKIIKINSLTSIFNIRGGIYRFIIIKGIKISNIIRIKVGSTIIIRYSKRYTRIY